MSYPHKHDLETTTRLSRYQGEAEARSLEGWLERGGYEPLRKAAAMSPDEITVNCQSFVNISALSELVEGQLVADVIAINASLDVVLGEIDR